MVKYFDVNDAGHSIRCKLYCTDVRGIRQMVLYGHGFGGHKDNKAAERFAETLISKHKGAAMLCFDWPCHGSDVKKKLILSDCGTYIDLVLKYIRSQFGVEDIYVYATSFGGYLFLKYIAEKGNPFCKVALRCPAINMYGTMNRNFMDETAAEKFRKGRDALMGFDRKISVSSQFLADLQAADISRHDFLEESERLMILHGTKDEVIPIEDVRSFADDNLIEFIPIEKADHRFQDYALMGAAIREILQFFDL